MKRMKDSTKWNKVVHQVNERINESNEQWKQEKNAEMHSQMMMDKWQMMNDEYEVSGMITIGRFYQQS